MSNERNSAASLTTQTLQRLPYYLRYLCSVSNDRVEYISAAEVAEKLGLKEVLVRKDLGQVSKRGGKPKVGFLVSELIEDIEEKLGYDSITDAVLVGVGSLGRALFSYDGFEKCGLRLAMGFDKNERVVGSKIHGKSVYSSDRIAELCRKSGITIGIIAVPEAEAQDACDRLIDGGVLAIWNFAPVKLVVPDNILVQNENLVSSLLVLSAQLKDRLVSK